MRAAGRILREPDRHTHAMLAYAQARLDELAPVLCNDLAERMNVTQTAVAGAFQPVFDAVAARLKVIYQGVEAWAAQQGTTVEAIIDATKRQADRE